MPEWLMGVDCKSAGYAYVGSNPTRPKTEHSFQVSIIHLNFWLPFCVSNSRGEKYGN